MTGKPMRSLEAEGDSIDDAIDRALRNLGVTRDQVEIEIISNASRGILGIGGRKAKVRATLRRPITVTMRRTIHSRSVRISVHSWRG